MSPYKQLILITLQKQQIEQEYRRCDNKLANPAAHQPKQIAGRDGESISLRQGGDGLIVLSRQGAVAPPEEKDLSVALKSVVSTSYYCSMVTIGLSCLVFEI